MEATIMFDKAKINPRRWTEDDMGLVDQSGDVGGDIQISDSFSRQFALALDNGEFAVLTFYTYVASEDENRHEADVIPEDAWVQTMVMYSHCTDVDDVGGSETYADIRYWDGTGQGKGTLDEARQICADLGAEDLSEAVSQMAV